jgi:hypothetical protein
MAELTCPPIDGAAVEETLSNLWHEFLAGWFDGAQHTLAGIAIDFPQAFILFPGQSLPDEGLSIQVIQARPGTIQRVQWAPDQWRVFEKAELDFYVRARVKAARSDGHNSRSLCRRGADLLHGLLSSIDATAPLSRKGLGAFRVSKPVLVADDATALRNVNLRTHLNYAAM